jgi:hypothetical protein
MIRRNVELEAKLIDDFLDLSRVVTGKLQLNLEAVDVNEAIRQVCETCRPFVRENGLHLHCDLPDANHFVKADPAAYSRFFGTLSKMPRNLRRKGEAFTSPFPRLSEVASGCRYVTLGSESHPTFSRTFSTLSSKAMPP